MISFVKSSMESLRSELLGITNKGVKAELETHEELKTIVEQISKIS